jgi:hypothetical protein
MDETQENNITFGYYWWGDTSRNIVFMRGHGGQYVFINQGLSIYDRIDTISN